MSLSYAKLDPDNNEIRLLTILPDENESNPVEGSLQIISLKDSHEFEALSYVWGDITVTTDVMNILEATVDLSGVAPTKNEADLRLGLLYNSIEEKVLRFRKTVNQVPDGEAKEFSEYLLKRLDLIHQKSFQTFVPLLPGDLLVQKDLHPDPGSPPSCPLGVLLSITTHRKRSNPLDRVYALYAMAPLVQEKYPPSYQKTVNQLNHETTAYILQYEGNMKIIENFNFFNDESLPSWVLDFVTTTQQHFGTSWAACSKQAVPEASLWQKPEGYSPTISDDLRILQLCGRVIGAVQESLTLSTESHAPLREILTHIERIRSDESVWLCGSGMTEKLIGACYNFTEPYGSLSFAFFSETLSNLGRDGQLLDMEGR
ncbi:uncharacterized protein BO80DRAFT_502848 [Aspergillus ibericus CBS 121593]|uniref:Heterokaryon incompatibility domain-containing protein n=1 Tax=Aspergillus ibericus CBS 121593 TaxID=1448316 RepID=A0A395GWX3_9EURO|nr:hypothetical protein BO80DRAFT_502848 [Aspergillus ibericus CBS 121593]RAK99922.1 hypothetical protein BO80DRAFT_502848 [Aspergillus ibericus CBS 121593]